MIKSPSQRFGKISLKRLTFWLALFSGLIINLSFAQEKPPVTNPDQMQMETGQTKPITEPSTEPVDIQKAGKAILTGRCSACHQAPDPKAHTLQEWPAIINRMAPQAFLNESEVKILKQYIEDEFKNDSTPDPQ